MNHTCGRFGKNITPKTCYCSGESKLHWLLALNEKVHDETYGFHIHNGASKRVIYERLLVNNDEFLECEIIGKVAATCNDVEFICTKNLEKGWYMDDECCYKWSPIIINYLLNYDEHATKENTLYRIRIASSSCISASNQFMLQECQK